MAGGPDRARAGRRAAGTADLRCCCFRRQPAEEIEMAATGHAKWTGDIESGQGEVDTGTEVARGHLLGGVAIRRRQGHQPGGADRGGARLLLLDGADADPRPGGHRAGERRDRRERLPAAHRRAASRSTRSRSSTVGTVPGIERRGLPEARRDREGAAARSRWRSRAARRSPSRRGSPASPAAERADERGRRDAGRLPALETLQTRWADNDVYGHVNNVEYYAFFDTVINRWLIARAGSTSTTAT